MSRRTAAALLITKGEGSELRVFLAERAPELRFFGGYWALPGGTVGEEDRAAGADEAAALHACVHRELFEETGLLRHVLLPIVDPIRSVGLAPGNRSLRKFRGCCRDCLGSIAPTAPDEFGLSESRSMLRENCRRRPCSIRRLTNPGVV